MRYFTFLYGVYPCNVVAFLRAPIEYLNEKGCSCPFTIGWDEMLDEDEIRSRSNTLLKAHVVHPSFLFQTAEQEFESSSNWQTDVPGLVGMCCSLDSRNAATKAERRYLDESHNPVDIWNEGGEILQHNNDIPTTDLIPRDQSPTKISINQLMEMHVALKSGTPVEIINDLTDISTTPRLHASHIPVFESAAASLSTTLERPVATPRSRSPGDVSLTSTQRDEARDSAIATLQRELLLAMNELNFEGYLRRQHLEQLRTLHTDSVNIRRSEMERQRMVRYVIPACAIL